MTRKSKAPVLRFLGGTGTVTGSRFLIDTAEARVLVDCGLYQGLKVHRLRNWAPFPVPPESIDAVLLTHAHVDHSGYLPALHHTGFRGPIYATRETESLCRIVLPDSAYLQSEEAAYHNRRGTSKHEVALSLFSQEDAQSVLANFVSVPFHEEVEVAPGVRAVFHRAGHILGSASIAVILDGQDRRTLVFSGDLGRSNHPLLLPPDPPPEADVMLVESTYGNREHLDDDLVERFADAVGRVSRRGGVIVIPAFAVDRTEVVLLHLKRLMDSGRIPELPVFVDSPMALAALSVYRDAISAGGTQIRPELRGQPAPFDIGSVVEARDVEASKRIHAEKGPAIIISASGMAVGGRVIHHLAKRLSDERNAIFLVGFQAAGTRGRRLLEGARTLKMLGRYVPVRAEIVDLGQFSVHADRRELVDWLSRSPREPEVSFVVHGEPEAADALRDRIEEELGWSAVVPSHLERVRLDRGR